MHLPLIIGGDFNSHHEWWSAGTPNSAGNALKDALEEANLKTCGLEQTLATFPRSQGWPDLLLSSQVAEGRTHIWVVEEHASDRCWPHST